MCTRIGKLTTVTMSRDSSVDIATRYGLDGFSAPVQIGLGAHQPPIQCVPNLFPGGKASGAWR